MINFVQVAFTTQAVMRLEGIQIVFLGVNLLLAAGVVTIMAISNILRKK